MSPPGVAAGGGRRPPPLETLVQTCGASYSRGHLWSRAPRRLGVIGVTQDAAAAASRRVRYPDLVPVFIGDESSPSRESENQPTGPSTIFF